MSVDCAQQVLGEVMRSLEYWQNHFDLYDPEKKVRRAKAILIELSGDLCTRKGIKEAQNRGQGSGE